MVYHRDTRAFVCRSSTRIQGIQGHRNTGTNKTAIGIPTIVFQHRFQIFYKVAVIYVGYFAMILPFDF